MRFRISGCTLFFAVLLARTVVAAPIHDAVLSRNIPSINQLIAQGVDINELDEFGFAALHWAVRDSQIEIVRILLEAGANVNITTGPQEGSSSTPLHYAVGEENEELLQLLFANGANIRTKDSSGNTPLHLASMMCSEVSVENILQNSRNQTITNDAGRVPGELTSPACSLPVTLYNPNTSSRLSDADDTYIAGIHGLRAMGLWGGAALATPGIVVMLSSILNENFGEEVIFSDGIIDDIMFGGMIAGASTMLFTAIETALNVQSHHLYGISLTYAFTAAALTATTVVLGVTGGLAFMTLVPSVWYAALATTGVFLQIDAVQQTTHRNSQSNTAISSNGSNTPNRSKTEHTWRPTVLLAGSQIIIRY